MRAGSVVLLVMTMVVQALAKQPSGPTNVKAFVTSGSAVTVTWQKAPAPAIGYRVQWGETGPRTQEHKLFVPGNLNCSVTLYDLPKACISVSVASVDPGGTATKPITIHAPCPLSNTRPGPPIALRAGHCRQWRWRSFWDGLVSWSFRTIQFFPPQVPKHGIWCHGKGSTSQFVPQTHACALHGGIADGGSPITAYVVEFANSHAQTRYEPVTLPASAAGHIVPVSHDDYTSFSVSAINEHGMTASVVEIDAVDDNRVETASFVLPLGFLGIALCVLRLKLRSDVFLLFHCIVLLGVGVWFIASMPACNLKYTEVPSASLPCSAQLPGLQAQIRSSSSKIDEITQQLQRCEAALACPPDLGSQLEDAKAALKERDRALKQRDRALKKQEKELKKRDELAVDGSRVPELLAELEKLKRTSAAELDALSTVRDRLIQRMSSLIDERDELGAEASLVPQLRAALEKLNQESKAELDAMATERDLAMQRAGQLVLERDQLAKQAVIIPQLQAEVLQATKERDSSLKRAADVTTELRKYKQLAKALQGLKDEL